MQAIIKSIQKLHKNIAYTVQSKSWNYFIKYLPNWPVPKLRVGQLSKPLYRKFLSYFVDFFQKVSKQRSFMTKVNFCPNSGAFLKIFRALDSKTRTTDQFWSSLPFGQKSCCPRPPSGENWKVRIQRKVVRNLLV